MTVEMTPELKSIIKQIRRDYKIAALATTLQHVRFIDTITELVKNGVPVADDSLLDQTMITIATCVSENIDPSPGKQATELASAIACTNKKSAHKVLTTASHYTHAQSAVRLGTSREFPINNQRNFIHLIDQTVKAMPELAADGIDALLPLVQIELAPTALLTIAACVEANPKTAEAGALIAMGAMTETLLVATETHEENIHIDNFNKQRSALSLMKYAGEANPFVAKNLQDTLQSVQKRIDQNETFNKPPYHELNNEIRETMSRIERGRGNSLNILTTNMEKALTTLNK